MLKSRIAGLEHTDRNIRVGYKVIIRGNYGTSEA